MLLGREAGHVHLVGLAVILGAPADEAFAVEHRRAPSAPWLSSQRCIVTRLPRLLWSTNWQHFGESPAWLMDVGGAASSNNHAALHACDEMMATRTMTNGRQSQKFDVLKDRMKTWPAAKSSPEEHDVRLGGMDGVVHPAPGLLHAHVAPLVLRRQASPDAQVRTRNEGVRRLSTVCVNSCGALPR